MIAAEKQQLISQLKRDILGWEGFRPPTDTGKKKIGLEAIEAAFPNGIFPIGHVHELISYSREQATATNGFITALLSQIAKGRTCLWVGLSCNLYPPALKLFGIDPERLLIARVNRPKEALWTTEEALKCPALGAVVANIRELSFTESRRLQLAVEESKVTGFIHRNNPRAENTVACVSRWKITPLPGAADKVLPGLVFPRWQVELQKVRNGTPGQWIIEYSKAGLSVIDNRPAISIHSFQQRKTG